MHRELMYKEQGCPAESGETLANEHHTMLLVDEQD